MRLNKTAARVIDLLELLAREEKPMTLLEIEKALEIPKSSTFELVYTLVEKEFINQDDKKFSLGVRAFQVGNAYSRKLDIVQVSKDILDNLAKECKETVFLAKCINDKMIYVDKHSEYADMSSTCTIGSSKELYCTALGKAILSVKSDSEIEDYFSRISIIKYTEYTIDKSEIMKKELRIVRTRGYATEYKEGLNDMCCVAAPVFDCHDFPVAAVSIAAPYYKMDEVIMQQFGALVNNAALELSYRLGFNGRSLY